MSPRGPFEIYTAEREARVVKKFIFSTPMGKKKYPSLVGTPQRDQLRVPHLGLFLLSITRLFN